MVSKSFPRSILFWASLSFLFMAPPAKAHDPFDSSLRMLARDDGEIEVVATLGLDAARQVLSEAGLSTIETAEALRVRGPHSTQDLPTTVATSLFSIYTD